MINSFNNFYIEKQNKSHTHTVSTAQRDPTSGIAQCVSIPIITLIQHPIKGYIRYINVMKRPVPSIILTLTVRYLSYLYSLKV